MQRTSFHCHKVQCSCYSACRDNTDSLQGMMIIQIFELVHDVFILQYCVRADAYCVQAEAGNREEYWRETCCFVPIRSDGLCAEQNYSTGPLSPETFRTVVARVAWPWTLRCAFMHSCQPGSCAEWLPQFLLVIEVPPWRMAECVPQ